MPLRKREEAPARGRHPPGDGGAPRARASAAAAAPRARPAAPAPAAAAAQAARRPLPPPNGCTPRPEDQKGAAALLGSTRAAPAHRGGPPSRWRPRAPAAPGPRAAGRARGAWGRVQGIAAEVLGGSSLPLPMCAAGGWRFAMERARARAVWGAGACLGRAPRGRRGGPQGAAPLRSWGAAPPLAAQGAPPQNTLLDLMLSSSMSTSMVELGGSSKGRGLGVGGWGVG
jgi:translation initiation factor IF-2